MPPPVSGEVTIQCLIDELRLHDLGVYLTRGESVTVTMSRALKSRDLSQAKIDGTVATQAMRSSGSRAQELVSSDTTTSQSPRHQPHRLPPATFAQDLNPLLAAVHLLTEEVRGVRKDLAALPHAPPVPPLDLGPLLAALKDLQGADRRDPPPSAPQAPVVAPIGGDTATPMFIPSNLTGGAMADTTVTIATSNTDNPDLGAASAALKAARKPR